MQEWFHVAVSSESETSMAPGLSRKLHRLFGPLIIAFVVLSSFRPPMDNVDIGWHVAQGRWMAEHGAVYRHDAFNYPNLGHASIDEYPLFQVVLYFAWSLGWWGAVPFHRAGLWPSVWFFDQGRKVSSSFGLALRHAGTGLDALIPATRLPRFGPHMATYLAVTVLGIFLLRHREAANGMTFWPMALLQVAWVNSHSGFILGPAMVGLFGAEMIVRPLDSLQTLSLADRPDVDKRPAARHAGLSG